jgi:hypothetical protein
VSTISLKLRHDAYDENDQLVLGYREDIDLDQLTPRARTVAEAIAQCSGHQPLDIWVERDKPLRETEPHWEMWYTPERAAQPERRPWNGWSRFPATSPMTAVEWLEREARKIPRDWHILGAHPRTPVPSLEAGAADQYLTRGQVLAYMRGCGRGISVSTWSAYTARGQAPQADRYVGRTPQWLPSTIDAFLDGTWSSVPD